MRSRLTVLICWSILTGAGLPRLSAQMVEERQYHGKRIGCVHSGIVRTNGTDCGTDGYARVFTGTVKSAFDIGESDKLLQLIPDEVFLGEPASEVMAVANQACLRHEILGGQKWLFYLHRDTRTNGLVLGYDSPSKPIAEAQDDIAKLRHLRTLGDSGLLAGTVTRIVSKDPWNFSRVQNHKIVVKRASDGVEFTSETDGSGYYELQVPPNSYTVSANTVEGLWAPETTASVRRSACVAEGFLLHTDGRISGTVTMADGKPAPYARIQIVPVSAKDQSFSVTADADGHFEVGGRDAGRYFVGAGVAAKVGSAQWQPSIYYPGVPNKDQARAIEFREGQWRADVKIKLPPNPPGQ
jgi:hypothetical protein